MPSGLYIPSILVIKTIPSKIQRKRKREIWEQWEVLRAKRTTKSKLYQVHVVIIQIHVQCISQVTTDLCTNVPSTIAHSTDLCTESTTDCSQQEVNKDFYKKYYWHTGYWHSYGKFSELWTPETSTRTINVWVQGTVIALNDENTRLKNEIKLPKFKLAYL